MFDLNDIANALKLAATTAFVEQTFTGALAGTVNPETVEIPAFDYTVTENVLPGYYELVTPYMDEARAFTLDVNQSLYSPENMLKVVGAGIAIYASHRRAELAREVEELNRRIDQEMEAASLRIAQEAGH